MIIYTSMFDCQRLSHLANFSEGPGSIPSSMSVGLNLDVPKKPWENGDFTMENPWENHRKLVIEPRNNGDLLSCWDL
jgi:hypothetical protein